MFPSQIQVVASTTGAAEAFNNAAGAPQVLTTTPAGHLRVDQVLPERTDMVRLGNSYGCAIATGLITVAAMPTTQTNLGIVNTAAQGGRSIIIDRVWGFIAVTAAAATQLLLAAQVVPAVPAITIPADVPTILRWSLSGKNATYGGIASLVTNVTTNPTAVANKWAVVGMSSNSSSTANVATGCEAFCYGRYVIAPGAAFCLTTITGTVTGAAGAFCGIEWHEVQLTLG